MEHSFNIDDAVNYGIEKAVIIKNLSFWIAKNMANKKHVYDGYCWTYNSASAFAELFPYMSAQKIARLLRELESDEIIKTGNYNKVGYDRTKWYTIPSLFAVQNQTIHCSNLNNGILKIEQPIPDINTDSKTDTLLMTQPSVKSSLKNEYPNEFEWLWENKPEREGGNPKKQAYSACKARLKEGATWREMAKGLNRYRAYCESKGIINTPMVQQMATFFGTKESFKELWEINHEANSRSNVQGANGRNSSNWGDTKSSSEQIADMAAASLARRRAAGNQQQ